MVTKVKEPAKKKTDWVPIVAAVGGMGILGVGLWFFLSKRGVSPGSKIKAHFTFTYSGAGGTYLLQVSLGHIRTFVFDHVEGLTWTQEVVLPEPGGIAAGPNLYEFDVIFSLPDFVAVGTYDGEALIRTEEMDWLEYYIKAENKGAVIVK